MKIGKLETHPVADLFPLLEGAQFAAMVADVKARGIDVPVVVQTKIRGGRTILLDGRNRERARLAANAELAKEHRPPIEMHAEEFQGRHAVLFIIAANLHRRHLGVGTRAVIGAKLAVLMPGTHQVGDASDVPTQLEAATMLGISERAVRQAKVVIDSGLPSLLSALERDRVAVDIAAEIARCPEDKQKDILKRLDASPARGSIRRLLRGESAQPATRKPNGLGRALDALRLLIDLACTRGLSDEGAVVAARELVTELTGDTHASSV